MILKTRKYGNENTASVPAYPQNYPREEKSSLIQAACLYLVGGWASITPCLFERCRSWNLHKISFFILDDVEA